MTILNNSYIRITKQYLKLEGASRRKINRATWDEQHALTSPNAFVFMRTFVSFVIILMGLLSQDQWPFQDPVPTMYKAYFLGLCKGLSPQNMA